jgi:protein phosphatase-4 regulatory subunit 3
VCCFFALDLLAKARASPHPGRNKDDVVAALTILSHNEPASELSLQQHLDITPSLVTYNSYATEGGDSEPLMMAQPVPHQATDKKRVKVYELRDNDWFDRGTGFCTATFATVRPPITSTRALALNFSGPSARCIPSRLWSRD